MTGITYTPGGRAVDDRGSVRFINDFDPMMAGVRRMYIVDNHKEGFVRAWHAHKQEAKYVMCLSGAAVVGAVKIADWDTLEKDGVVHRTVLNAGTPKVMYIPAGYANGFMSLSDDTSLVFFSTSTLEESKGDDIRIDARNWDIWEVEER
jgi:dTDP-4-dehydrorhamnose 3,5-epimerase